MVEFKRAVVRELGDAGTGVLLDPEIGVGPAIADGSLPGGPGSSSPSRRPGYEGPPGARVSRVLPGWGVAQVKRLGRPRPSSSSTTTRTRRTPRTRSGSSPTWRPPVARPTSPCSSSRSRSGSTGASSAARTGGGSSWRRRARLTALGADILKAEFPYDAAVTDEARWAEACAELDAATPLPWVLLSGGVDDATFERQVAVACRAGASGVLVGRSVWAEAATLAPARGMRSSRRPVGTGSPGSPRSSTTSPHRGARAGRRRPRPSRPAPGWYGRY